MVEEKEMEIQILRDEVAQMSTQVDGLTARIDTLVDITRVKDRIIDEQVQELNTAYFITGTRRELEDAGIIAREGGVLGLGRTEKLRADFPTEKFTQIDTRRTRTITITGKRPRLVSVHPETSWRYLDEQQGYSLLITDPDTFWSATRYLVVATD